MRGGQRGGGYRGSYRGGRGGRGHYTGDHAEGANTFWRNQNNEGGEAKAEGSYQQERPPRKYYKVGEDFEGQENPPYKPRKVYHHNSGRNQMADGGFEVVMKRGDAPSQGFHGGRGGKEPG